MFQSIKERKKDYNDFLKFYHHRKIKYKDSNIEILKRIDNKINRWLNYRYFLTNLYLEELKEEIRKENDCCKKSKEVMFNGED